MKIMKTIALAITMILSLATITTATNSEEGKQQVREAVTKEAQDAYEIYSRKGEKEGSVHMIFRVNELYQLEVLNVYGSGDPHLWGLTIAALNGKTIHASDELIGKELSMKISYLQIK